MTTYNAILNSQIDPESPVDTALMTALRDNPIAMFEGAANAPRLSVAAVQPGGGGGDGAFVDATSVTASGKFDWTSVTITAAKGVPHTTIHRVFGNVSISSTFSADACATSAEANIAKNYFGCRGGNDSVSDSGGGSVGDGGAGSGAAAAGLGAISNVRNLFAFLPMIIGGSSNITHLGGGVLVFIVHGNMVLTGGTLRANAAQHGAGAGKSGSGGGSVIVICTGTITDGTFEAKGSNSPTAGVNCGGGGGGLVLLVASAYAGTQTMTVTGGTGQSGGASGGSGYSEKITLTESQINALMLGIK